MEVEVYSLWGEAVNGWRLRFLVTPAIATFVVLSRERANGSLKWAGVDLRKTLRGSRHVGDQLSELGVRHATQEQERIFDPFWRAEATSAGGSEGTGLGLAVARQLARILGGDVIVASSELGRGSNLRRLPAGALPVGD